MRSIQPVFSLRSIAIFLIACLAAFAATSASFGQDEVDFDAFDDAEQAAPAEPGAAAEQGSDAGGAASDATEEGGKRDSYLVWMYRSLGWFFTIVFSLLSLTMVALIVINIVALQRSALAPEELAEEFGALLDQNKFQEAYELAKNDESLLGKSLATGLARMPNGFDKAIQAMQDVEQEETMRLEHQLGYLALIGNLAPMIGLFGTVVGMIASFQAIASGGAAPSPQKLAEGIATALFTTELGLAIALPALAAYDILKNRLQRFVLDVAVLGDNFMGRFSNVGAPRQ